ncbi:urease [Artemisia annua]|uniref:Urease n=1 Tax=Artemisia annua TaxID=35608 RepID=A0A2U1NHN2_ARTAN|nr:urease [Artemisia annua]
MVIKGGDIAYANMGDPNASIPTPQPHSARLEALTPLLSSARLLWTAIEGPFTDSIKKVTSVKNVIKLTKLDMKLNDALPSIEVDPESYGVTSYLGHTPTNISISASYFKKGSS